MATVLKTDPKGIDFIIDSLQKKTFTELTAVGGIGWTDYESYHRAYKNPQSGSTIPEIYTTSGNYLEVLFDDTFSATSFVLSEDSRTKIDHEVYAQDISIIFQAQLDKLYPSIDHRADEEMHADIVTAINAAGFQKDITEVTTGVSNVYSELSLTGDLSSLVSLDDMSFFHVVKVDLTITYGFDNCGTVKH